MTIFPFESTFGGHQLLGVCVFLFWIPVVNSVVATQILFIFIPILGEDEAILTIFFQMGGSTTN